MVGNHTKIKDRHIERQTDMQFYEVRRGTDKPDKDGKIPAGRTMTRVGTDISVYFVAFILIFAVGRRCRFTYTLEIIQIQHLHFI